MGERLLSIPVSVGLAVRKTDMSWFESLPCLLSIEGLRPIWLLELSDAIKSLLVAVAVSNG